MTDRPDDSPDRDDGTRIEFPSDDEATFVEEPEPSSDDGTRMEHPEGETVPGDGTRIELPDPDEEVESEDGTRIEHPEPETDVEADDRAEPEHHAEPEADVGADDGAEPEDGARAETAAPTRPGGGSHRPTGWTAYAGSAVLVTVVIVVLLLLTSGGGDGDDAGDTTSSTAATTSSETTATSAVDTSELNHELAVDAAGYWDPALDGDGGAVLAALVELSTDLGAATTFDELQTACLATEWTTPPADVLTLAPDAGRAQLVSAAVSVAARTWDDAIAACRAATSETIEDAARQVLTSQNLTETALERYLEVADCANDEAGAAACGAIGLP